MAITILIADDHRLYRVALHYLLQNTEPALRVIAEAEDGLQTVQRTLRLKPDVVLMDIAMPGLNGIHATRRIREQSPGVHILALSAHVKYEYVVDMLKAGAGGFLDKNCDQHELQEAIRAVVRGDMHLCECAAAVIAKDASRRLGAGEEDQVGVLTPREQEVLQLLAEGSSPKEAAAHLGLSEATVHTHRHHIFEKLGLRGIADLVRYAIRSGIIEA